MGDTENLDVLCIVCHLSQFIKEPLQLEVFFPLQLKVSLRGQTTEGHWPRGRCSENVNIIPQIIPVSHSLLKERNPFSVTATLFPIPAFKTSVNSALTLTIARRQFKCKIKKGEEKVDFAS